MQFNSFVLELEQEEYQREGIQWDYVAFKDNSACISFFEEKGTGLIAILDEECRLPGGSDENFAQKVHKIAAPFR